MLTTTPAQERESASQGGRQKPPKLGAASGEVLVGPKEKAAPRDQSSKPSHGWSRGKVAICADAQHGTCSSSPSANKTLKRDEVSKSEQRCPQNSHYQSSEE